MAIRRTSSVLGLSLLLAIQAASLSAEPEREGYYVSLGLGVAADYDEEKLDLPGAALDSNIDLSAGYTGVLGAVGYQFGNGFRVEGAIGYTRQDVGSISRSAVTATLGDAVYNEIMLNGYYDFRRGKVFQPYLGLGIGGSRLSYKGTQLLGGGGLEQIRDSDYHPAGQVILGMGWRTGQNTFLAVEYNYLSSLGDVDVELSNGSRGNTTFDTHRLIFKYRYHFQ